MGQHNEKGDKGFCILCVGGTGSGKSYFIKNRMLPEFSGEFMIFDINKEYLNFPNTYKKFIGHEDFMKIAKERTNTNIIFEEATAFFRNRGGGGAEALSLMVRKRHQNNNLVFVFHSLRAIPVEIFDFVNYIILFDTNDREDLVKSKYKEQPQIWGAFKELQSEKQPFKKKIIQLY